jgi:hypothetical protein
LLGWLLCGCAAPWYVYNTLLRSPRRVDDPNDADIIFVYDYCRLMCATFLLLPFADCGRLLPAVVCQ